MEVETIKGNHRQAHRGEPPHCPRQDYNTIQTQALANMALLLSSSRTHAKGKLALRFQGQVVHALRLFLQEKQKGPVGNTPQLCLNPLYKAGPDRPRRPHPHPCSCEGGFYGSPPLWGAPTLLKFIFPGSPSRGSPSWAWGRCSSSSSSGQQPGTATTPQCLETRQRGTQMWPCPNTRVGPWIRSRTHPQT